MRYRSLGSGRTTLSAVSLSLDPDGPSPKALRGLVFAALEGGVNTFQVQADDVERLGALGSALGSLDRELVVVGVRLAAAKDGAALDGRAMTEAVERAVAASGLGRLDLVLLDPEGAPANPDAAAALEPLRRSGLIRFTGVAGEGPSADALVKAGGLDVLATRFSLLSGWPERNRIKAAQERRMAVIGYGYWSERMRADEPPAAAPPKRSLFRLGRRDRGVPLAKVDGYEFLETTAGWTAQEICLAYALTEPGLSTVQTSAASPDVLEGLCAVPEREMPTGLAAQIEMGRFSATGAKGR